jgi:hypothetical protein
VRTYELSCTKDGEIAELLGARNSGSEGVTRLRYRTEARHHVVAPSRVRLQPQAVSVGQPHLSSVKLLDGASQAHHFSKQPARVKSADMDFLKSAVASAISKGPAFGYTFGDRVDLNDSIWTLHNGTKRVWPEYLSVYRIWPANLSALGRWLQM